MTREEAIKKLQRHKAEYLDEWVDFSGIAEALDMAIRALKNEQSEQNVGMCQQNVGEMSEKQTDGDLISRTELLNKIWRKEYGKDYDGVNLLNIPHIDIIEQMPSAEKTAVITVTNNITNAEIVKKLKTYCTKVEIDKSAEKTAEWKPHYNEKAQYYMFGYVCSKCGAPAKSPTKYCSNCGANMHGGNSG